MGNDGGGAILQIISPSARTGSCSALKFSGLNPICATEG